MSSIKIKNILKKSFLKKEVLLYFTAFVCGAVVMILELVGSRILAPHVGNSIFVWTNLIGIIMGSLAIGYWLGGAIADKSPRPETLILIIVGASLSVVLVWSLIAGNLLFLLPLKVGIQAKALIYSVLLFAIPGVVLGMVSPFISRLVIIGKESPGKRIGGVYSLSTIGSILGTYLAGYYLIPTFGIKTLLIILYYTLALLTIIICLFYRREMLIYIVVPVFLLSIVFATQENSDKIIETQYSSVKVVDTTSGGRPSRLLLVNSEPDSAKYLDGKDLLFEYTKYYDLAEYFKPNYKNSLMIGGAGYSYPQYYLCKYPDKTMDVVEIDPGLTKVARDYFGLKDDNRLKIFHEDGRTYLDGSSKKYDVIFGDAFKSYFPPSQLVTREAINKIYSLTNDGGIFIVNIISSINGDGSKFLKSELKTIQSVFDNAFVYKVNSQSDDVVQNLILVATKNNQMPPTGGADTPTEIKAMLNNYVSASHINTEKSVILTDDYSPSEYQLIGLIKK